MAFTHRIDDREGVQLISLAGKLLGGEATTQLTDAVTELVEQGKCYLVVDLQELTHMNSSGLGALILMLTKARNRGGELVVCRVPDTINKLLVITKLNNVFTQEDDLDAAVARMAKELQANA